MIKYICFSPFSLTAVRQGTRQTEWVTDSMTDRQADGRRGRRRWGMSSSDWHPSCPVWATCHSHSLSARQKSSALVSAGWEQPNAALFLLMNRPLNPNPLAKCERGIRARVKTAYSQTACSKRLGPIHGVIQSDSTLSLLLSDNPVHWSEEARRLANAREHGVALCYRWQLRQDSWKQEFSFRRKAQHMLLAAFTCTEKARYQPRFAWGLLCLNCLLEHGWVESLCCPGETSHLPHPQVSNSGLILPGERTNHRGHVCRLAVCHHVVCWHPTVCKTLWDRADKTWQSKMFPCHCNAFNIRVDLNHRSHKQSMCLTRLTKLWCAHTEHWLNFNLPSEEKIYVYL